MLQGDPRLGSVARQTILVTANDRHWSIASLWEVAIKISIDKLDLATDWRAIVDREMLVNGIRWIPIHPEHCVRVAGLPFLHRDPFDRLLIAQAQVEGMVLLTADDRFAPYQVPVLW